MPKKTTKHIKIILIIIGILIIGACTFSAIKWGNIGIIFFMPFILLMSRAEHHTVDVNNTFDHVDNYAIKEIAQREFKIEDTTYIRKITYTAGFDDDNVYEICVYYKKDKKCKKSNSSLGRADTYDYMENK